MALDISKAFDRVWHAGLLHKRKSCGISLQIFGLLSSFSVMRRLQVVLDRKSSQEYPVNGVPLGFTGLEIWQKRLFRYRIISVINKDDSNNLFPQIHLHNTNAF